jgi:hypothetical protein
MKFYSRRAAALVLAAALLIPTVAFAFPNKADRSERKNPVVRIIKKLFGIAPNDNDDIPIPPIPKPPPPPTP